MFVNRRNVRIEWGDCDPAGIVYFPRYVEVFDACTTHLLEAAGFPKAQTLKRFGAAGFPIVDLKTKFLVPASYGDDVLVETEITEVRRSSFDVRHRLFRSEQLAVEGFETRVWTVHDPDMPGRLKSSPLPEEIKAALG
jgi:4-hydroxybenzoyl-CoA thioesterase